MASLRILVLFWCCLFLHLLPVEAQTSQHSLKVGYGFVSIQGLDLDVSGGQSSSVQETKKLMGPLNMSYTFTFKKFVQLGLGWTMVKETTRFTSTQTPSYLREDRLHSQAIMPHVGFVWKWSGKWYAYSNYMVGINFRKESRSEKGFLKSTKRETSEAYQLNLVGVTYGKKLKGFAEFGVGIAGVVNGGLSLEL
ncbi:hypothetical protein FOE74_19145 [Rufibacter glacialis]|nr:hypothetical protein FOE74_19145 [Rufibacter glacialis]